MHSGGPTLPSKRKMVSYPHVLYYSCGNNNYKLILRLTKNLKQLEDSLDDICRFFMLFLIFIKGIQLISAS